ncbi:L,D-transpeptidase family protein [Hymenobacter busanensis]|nr:L,D-transpeptidase family protein [Hymenobacter busanensis]
MSSVLFGFSPAFGQSNAEVAAVLQRVLVADSSQAELRPVRRFYAALNFAPAWTSPAGWLPLSADALRLLTRAPEFGLLPAEYELPALLHLTDSLQCPGASAATRLVQRVRCELLFTKALLNLGQHLQKGRLAEQPFTTGTTVPPDPDAANMLLRARRSGSVAASLLALQPTGRSYVRLLWAWQHLLRTDTAAARRLRPTVAINLERLRWEPAADSLYVVVNIPSYTLQVVRGPQVVRSFRVIVGETPTPTPELYSHIRFFETSPEWRVPHSIAVGEMLPRLRRNPGYLGANNFLLYDRQGKVVNPRSIKWQTVTPETFVYSIRQIACCDNALGNVVFRFPNPHDIFVHDTPTRELFNKRSRALSHGCIRLEKPLQLASFLLRRDYGSKAQSRIDLMWDSVYSGYGKFFPLRNPVPIVVRYVTCEADGPQLRLLPDVYGRDEALQKRFFDVPTASPLVSVGN